MKVMVTGGFGYIGSALLAHLIARGDRVRVLDDLWFGGESLLPFFCFDTFEFIKGDICADDILLPSMEDIDCVVHLAAIVGFPACKKAGREVVWRTNVEGTKKVYEAACRAGVKRMLFASSYSNYGESKAGELVTEESPLYPKSVYAESKIAAERFLLARTGTQSMVTVCLRLATVFGVSPRTRFDLILNQFVMEALRKGRLTLYQENFRRSFVHVRDVVRAMMCVLDAPVGKVRNQVFNVGSEALNTSKQELAAMIQRYLPKIRIEYRDTSFAADMRSIHVSYQKIRDTLQFETTLNLENGIEELIHTLGQGVIRDPSSEKYYNHPPILV